MRGKLTKRAVDALKASQSHDLYLWDTDLPGFGCRVKTGSGVKSFIVQYRAPGLPNVSRRLTVGRYGPLTVEEARKQAKDLLARVELGRDVAQEKSEAHRRAHHETVELLFVDYLDHARAHWKPSTIRTFEYDAALHILPRLGRLPVQKVTTRDVAAMHLELKRKPPTANRCVRAFRAFWYWCERRGLVSGVNPARNVELYRETARERFLTVEEMARLGEALRTAEKVGLPSAPQHKKHHRQAKHTRTRNAGMFKSEVQPASPIAVAALRFLLFTGWREREALTLTWNHLDMARGIATLPDTKSGKSVRTLGAPALELLAEQPRLKDSPYVFPGRTPEKPLIEIQRLWYAARYAARLEDVRLHDLRHSVASFAGGKGYSLFLIQKLLGHKDSRSTERYAHLADDIRKVVADDVSETVRQALNADPSSAKTKAAGHLRRA